MARNNKKPCCFVISLVRSGIKLYFVREEAGELDLKTGEVIKESRGWFSPDLLEAKKFLSKEQAQIICAGYKGASVEIIKTGEVLK